MSQVGFDLKEAVHMPRTVSLGNASTKPTPALASTPQTYLMVGGIRDGLGSNKCLHKDIQEGKTGCWRRNRPQRLVSGDRS